MVFLKVDTSVINQIKLLLNDGSKSPPLPKGNIRYRNPIQPSSLSNSFISNSYITSEHKQKVVGYERNEDRKLLSPGCNTTKRELTYRRTPGKYMMNESNKV